MPTDALRVIYRRRVIPWEGELLRHGQALLRPLAQASADGYSWEKGHRGRFLWIPHGSFVVSSQVLLATSLRCVRGAV